jgi:hypothetical protein
MSHKRKGQITTSGEWAKHLRPFLRRAFWKKERQAAHGFVRTEETGMQVNRSSTGTLEFLLAEVEALPTNAAATEIWIPEHLTFQGQAISHDLAMAILTDKLLSRELFPQDVGPALGGRLHRYCKE